jgi:predicted nucleic acid-binding protein
MSEILIDSSVWIAFFKGDEKAKPLAELIAINKICVNELILSEIIPSLNMKNEKRLISLFSEININPLRINWEEIILLQTKNLKHGLNKIGIPDLLIIQNSLQYKTPIFSFDKHFPLMKQLHKFETFMK